ERERIRKDNSPSAPPRSLEDSEIKDRTSSDLEEIRAQLRVLMEERRASSEDHPCPPKNTDRKSKGPSQPKQSSHKSSRSGSRHSLSSPPSSAGKMSHRSVESIVLDTLKS